MRQSLEPELRGAGCERDFSVERRGWAWSGPTHWTHSPADVGADYPNDDSLTYAVTISFGNVLLQEPVTIQGLTLNGGTLVNDSTLTVSN